MAVADRLAVGEAADRVVLGVVGGAQQKARQGEADVARIFALAKALPLGELRAVEVILEVFQVGQAGVTVQPKKASAGGGDEGRVGHAGNPGHLLQQADILGAGAKFVVGDHGANGLPAKLTVLCCIDMFVQAGLNQFRAVFKVIEQILFGGVD